MGFIRATPAVSGFIEAATAGQDLIRPNYSAHGNGPTITQAPTRGIPSFAATAKGGIDLDGHQF